MPGGILFNLAQVDEVAREGLAVDAVSAMHGAPMSWKQVIEALNR